MANFFKANADGGFDSVALPADGVLPMDSAALDCAGPLNATRIMSFVSGTRPTYLLIAAARSDVRVNGSAVVGAIRVLQHQDEVSVGAQRLFFSAQAVPLVELYRCDGSPRRLRCPVCRGEIQDEQQVVRCPGCSRLFHQIPAGPDTPEKPCWTYSPECRFCTHPTSLSGEAFWQPGGEECQ